MIQFRPADRVDPSEPPVPNESVIQLVRGIVQDARTLSVKEFAAAKLEAKQEIGKIAKVGVSFGAGMFLLALGVIFLSLMLVLVLQQYTTLLLWQSLGAVGLFYVIVGAIVLVIGKSKAVSVRPIPEKSLRSAKEDIRYIRERAVGH
jgi:Putative Actinobacterial Holin-X, holin superfamily III